MKSVKISLIVAIQNIRKWRSSTVTIYGKRTDISDINYDICSMLYKGDFNKCIGYGDEKLTLAISIFVYRSLYTNPFYVAVDIYIL